MTDENNDGRGRLISSRTHPRGAPDPALAAEIEASSRRAPDWIELRPAEDGSFDEIVANFADGMVHVETLDDGSVYVGFYKPGAGEPTTSGLQLWITSDGALRYSHADIGPAPTRGTPS